jgi:hypothetical protein
MMLITKNTMDERWEGGEDGGRRMENGHGHGERGTKRGKGMEERGWRVEIVNSVKIVRSVESVWMV